ncbi:hypothetical protein MTR67_015290 [Solanum verrucosum]|uniref:Uncharacterized protein n=1 Tax=Solanum verrucosum TaxID=315347 RepID=A0AAF0QGL2_SOLVR|nr:hypothetical protein MTR67_015290 [Solanum verrucosum]
MMQPKKLNHLLIITNSKLPVNHPQTRLLRGGRLSVRMKVHHSCRATTFSSSSDEPRHVARRLDCIIDSSRHIRRKKKVRVLVLIKVFLTKSCL